MFTGIITGVGRIAALHDLGSSLSHGKRLTLEVPAGYLDDVGLGDSIAINGACMTVTSFDLAAQQFTIDISAESLDKTSGLDKLGKVNLEKALLATGRLGGHLVSGHVDGISSVEKIEKFGEAWQVWIKMPKDLAHYIAEKGSITVDGISLTVNELSSSAFRLTIVPHTARETTLMSLKEGSQVHLEVDLIARYLERLLQGREGAGSIGVTMDLLQQRGFL